jgi:hypothetical protein
MATVRIKFRYSSLLDAGGAPCQIRATIGNSLCAVASRILWMSEPGDCAHDPVNQHNSDSSSHSRRGKLECRLPSSLGRGTLHLKANFSSIGQVRNLPIHVPEHGNVFVEISDVGWIGSTTFSQH